MIGDVFLILWSILVLYTFFCIVMARVRKKPDSDTILIEKKMRVFATYEVCGFFGLLFVFQLILKLVGMFN